VSERDQPRVLIVGAGPVGIVLACELLAQGVDVQIVSRTRRIGPHSRATILWPRILELLDRTGVAETLVEGGHYFDQMNYYSDKRRIGRIRFDRMRGVGYPFAITIPQWRTEAILEARLGVLGGEVSYGHEFLGGAQVSDGVRVKLRIGGEEVDRTYDWVVGADGFDSTVRGQFGFDSASVPACRTTTPATIPTVRSSRRFCTSACQV
jgi:2-polyprenyl-6-methoxyphenol hydroxylase-like FAD-dependent oxidoreductase